MKELQSNRAGCTIQTSVELAGLFEAEAQWEAAEQTRVLLYYLLRDDRPAARRILKLLGDEAPVVESPIQRRVSELAALLRDSETGGNG